MTKKFKLVAITALVLWLVVLIQIMFTRFVVSEKDVWQAFARNQITSVREETDSRNVKEGNTCLMGKYPGRLSLEEQEALTNRLFRSLGGGSVLTSSMDTEADYYVAYGYTTGIETIKKVNGKRINMNVAISYNEKEDCTEVVMGIPLINSDF